MVRRSCEGGDPNSRRMTSLNCRMLEKPAANAISASGRSVCSTSSRAVWARRLTASCSGPAPTSATSVRCTWRSLTCRVCASPDTPDSSTTPSAISRSARDGEVAAVVPVPRPRCRVGSAPLARPEPGAHRRGRCREVPHVLLLRRLRRAHRAAVDTGARDAEPQPSVEAAVAARERLVGRVDVEARGSGVRRGQVGRGAHGRESAARRRHPAGGNRTRPSRSSTGRATARARAPPARARATRRARTRPGRRSRSAPRPARPRTAPPSGPRARAGRRPAARGS